MKKHWIMALALVALVTGLAGCSESIRGAIEKDAAVADEQMSLALDDFDDCLGIPDAERQSPAPVIGEVVANKVACSTGRKHIVSARDAARRMKAPPPK